MIAIIDYGMGNLRSVQKAFEAAGHQAVVTRERRVLNDASHLVLPGVGAFADCMANLEQYGLIEPIRSAIAGGKPFLGICLGLQLLFTESEEFGRHKGLDLVPGRVKRFPWGPAGTDPLPRGSVPVRAGQAPAVARLRREPVPRLKVPHMGWNALTITREAPPLRGVETGAHFYFVHSYYVEPSDPSVACTMTEYGIPFVSSIWRDNVFACQFHPEKSQTAGLRIVRNFGAWR
ncbi:MAG: imidazole glycerol phosphate synthase subunit HisH [Nitrospiraceae bacterium]